MNTVQFRVGLALGALLMFLSVCVGAAFAQTPNPVTLGYQICNTNDPGNTHCSWQPVDATHPVPTGTGGGNVSNGATNVAPTSTNLPVVSYDYIWNGASWNPATGLTTGTVGVPSAAVVTTQFPASGGAYPTAASPIAGNASGTTGAVVGTLAGTSGKTTYICDFDVSAIGGTAAVGPIVVAGLLGGSKTYQMSSSAAGVTLTKSFNPCIPASTTNTSITITTTADGTATAVNVNSSGYQQ